MIKLKDIADHVGASVSGLPDMDVVGVNTLEDAGASEISYVSEGRYLSKVEPSGAGAFLVSEALGDVATGDRPRLIVKDAGLAADKVLSLYAFEGAVPEAGVSPSAHVDESATVHPSASVGPGCVVARGSSVGAGSVLIANVYIGADASVGDDCRLHPGVVLYDRVTVADRVTLHANVSLGSDGFGYRFDGAAHRKIPHVGTVAVESDVEIGASTTIDRGKFAETRIGAGTKIDNLVQIAHNVRVGKLCIICANVGIAGSAKLGDGVILAGGAGVRDHIKIGAGARVRGVQRRCPRRQTRSDRPGCPGHCTARLSS